MASLEKYAQAEAALVPARTVPLPEMKRLISIPRPNWQAKVEEVGLSYPTPIIIRIDLEEEIKKGNITAAILSAAAIIAIVLIVAASMS